MSVELEISHIKEGSCDDDSGLTTDSILLEYRNISLPNSAPDSEWILLGEIQLIDGMTHEVDVSDDVQFRLLQLEHGGGRCNCWRVERLEVILNNGTMTNFMLQAHTCAKLNHDTADGNPDDYCGGPAWEARGLITTVLTHNGTITEDCPGDSNRTLIPSIRPPLSTSCAEADSRM